MIRPMQQLHEPPARPDARLTGRSAADPTRPLSAAFLKWLAILTMFIDHIGAAVLEPWLAQNSDSRVQMIYTVCRLIGRLAFPIFAFLLTEGIVHTRNGWSYIGRLAGFAILSEIPFDLAVFNQPFNFSYQNIFVTLTLAAFSLHLHRLQQNEVLRWGVLIIAPVLAWLLASDYGSYGILVIYVFYFFREWMLVRNILGGSLLLAQWTAVLALVPISLYNGERGRQLKYFFYIFYPAHLLLLWAIARQLVYA